MREAKKSVNCFLTESAMVLGGSCNSSSVCFVLFFKVYKMSVLSVSVFSLLVVMMVILRIMIWSSAPGLIYVCKYCTVALRSLYLPVRIL